MEAAALLAEALQPTVFQHLRQTDVHVANPVPLVVVLQPGEVFTAP
jgi:hypothetical protein